MGRGNALSRTGRNVDHYTRLFPKFRRWCARDNFHRRDRIQRNLVGEDLALLVGNRLPIDRERVLRVIAHSVKETIRVCRDSG